MQHKLLQIVYSTKLNLNHVLWTVDSQTNYLLFALNSRKQCNHMSYFLKDEKALESIIDMIYSDKILIIIEGLYL